MKRLGNMIKHIVLKEGWELTSAEPCYEINPDSLTKLFEAKNRELVYKINKMPSQVHDVLLSYEKIINPNIRGINNDTWIEDKIWVYRCLFKGEKISGPVQFHFEGLDTYAQVFLNGKKIGDFCDAYMHHTTESVDGLEEENILFVCFFPTKRIVKNIYIPDEYDNAVPDFGMTRAFRSGLQDYNGPKPTLVRIGIFGSVILEVLTPPIILDTQILTEYDSQIKRGTVKAIISGVFQNGQEISVKIYDANGVLVQEAISIFNGKRCEIKLDVEKPIEWYPRTHGNPYCYSVLVKASDEVIKKTIGFRSIELCGDLFFRINGIPVRMWGANLSHPDTVTNCYNRERVNRLLFLCEVGNYNMLRVWGEGELLDEEFYDECDRRGILLWQDFYYAYGMYSEEPEYLDLCRKEAVQLVKAISNHPSILLWCGGNEMYLYRDYTAPGCRCYGSKIIEEVLPEVCKTYDPERFYWPSSPSGSRWANDPSAGDTHGYTHLWFVPGRLYPSFVSENNRVATPALRTMKVMMTAEELWPASYDGKVTLSYPYPWPKTWFDHNTNDGHLKVGPIEHYFDPDNAEQLIYRLGAAYAEYIKKEVGRFRRGKDSSEKRHIRKTAGHLVWKLNNNSNIISYGIIDYLLEPYYPYYELKRQYEPLLISFEIDDHINVWMTNDTTTMFDGEIEVKLFDLAENRFIKTISVSCELLPDESKSVLNLDCFGQFRKTGILFAQAYSKGHVVGRAYESVEIERRMGYPNDCGLTLSRDLDNTLVLSTKKYARCVELLGKAENGNEFGWVFSDNYFDVFPGEEVRIKILRGEEHGIITAKPIYDNHIVNINY